jgi:cytochrome c-type biogenesis protein
VNALVYSSSLAAAFLGGMLALFAPCCVVSLLPNFVAISIRRGLRRLPFTTVVFAAGVATVLLPIVLGIGALGQLLASFHTAIFFAVGGFLILLGLFTLSGRNLMLPTPAMSSASSAGGVYSIGLVSGVASSCCAPVVVGVVAMSALAGSTIGALGLGLAYVFGMVFPLFISAILWQRLRLGERIQLLRRMPRLLIAGRRVSWNDAVAGAMFIVIGVVSVVLATTGQASFTPGPLAAWDRWTTGRVADVAIALGGLPVWLQAAGLTALAIATLLGVNKAWRSSQTKLATNLAGLEPPVRTKGGLSR